MILTFLILILVLPEVLIAVPIIEAATLSLSWRIATHLRSSSASTDKSLIFPDTLEI
jgi:hypothetical protein